MVRVHPDRTFGRYSYHSYPGGHPISCFRAGRARTRGVPVAQAMSGRSAWRSCSMCRIMMRLTRMLKMWSLRPSAMLSRGGCWYPGTPAAWGGLSFMSQMLHPYHKSLQLFVCPQRHERHTASRSKRCPASAGRDPVLFALRRELRASSLCSLPPS